MLDWTETIPLCVLIVSTTAYFCHEYDNRYEASRDSWKERAQTYEELYNKLVDKCAAISENTKLKNDKKDKGRTSKKGKV